MDIHFTAFNLGITLLSELNNSSRFADGCRSSALVLSSCFFFSSLCHHRDERNMTTRYPKGQKGSSSSFFSHLFSVSLVGGTSNRPLWRFTKYTLPFKIKLLFGHARRMSAPMCISLELNQVVSTEQRAIYQRRDTKDLT